MNVAVDVRLCRSETYFLFQGLEILQLNHQRPKDAKVKGQRRWEMIPGISARKESGPFLSSTNESDLQQPAGDHLGK